MGDVLDEQIRDAMVDAGGENRGPRPLEDFHARSAFCRQVIYAKNALATGIEITDLSMEVQDDVEPSDVLCVEGGSPGFVDDELRDTTSIESPVIREEVRQLVDLAERHCPAHAAVRGSMDLAGDVILDGGPLGEAPLSR